MAGPDVFASKSVALLLIGQTFRSAVLQHRTRYCDDSSASLLGQADAVAGFRSQVIEPLLAAGAEVEVLFTFPRCGSEKPALLGNFSQWLAPHAVAHKVVDSQDLTHGWRLGHLLLTERLRWRKSARLRPYDYVLQARSDLKLDASILTWPRRGFVVPPSTVDPDAARYSRGDFGRRRADGTPLAANTADGYIEPPASLRATVTFDDMLFEQEGLLCEGVDTGDHYCHAAATRATAGRAGRVLDS